MSNERPRRRTLHNILLVLGGLALLAILSCGGLFYWGMGQMRDVEAAADAFMGELAGGRTDEAYQRTDAAFQAHASREAFSEMIAKYPLVTKHTSLRKGARRVQATPQGPTAFIEYLLGGPDGFLPVRVTLVRNETWKVVGLNLPELP